MESLQSILSRLGLRVRFRFMDFCTMSEASDFCRAEYDIQLGYSRFNERVADRISEMTGRRRALRLDVPMGLTECIDWIHGIAEYAPELAPLVPSAEESLRREFEDGIERFRPLLQGRRVAIYCIMVRDLKWQVETLEALGVDVRAVMFTKGHMVDHNLRIPDYGNTRIIDDAGMCDLKRLVVEEGVEMVLTNDPPRATGRRDYEAASRRIPRRRGRLGIARYDGYDDQRGGRMQVPFSDHDPRSDPVVHSREPRMLQVEVLQQAVPPAMHVPEQR